MWKQTDVKEELILTFYFGFNFSFFHSTYYLLTHYISLFIMLMLSCLSSAAKI